jgi:hypothetical protein
MPGAGASRRGSAQRRRLDPVRLNSATLAIAIPIEVFESESFEVWKSRCAGINA